MEMLNDKASVLQVYNEECSTPEFGSGIYIPTLPIYYFLFPFSRLLVDCTSRGTIVYRQIHSKI